MQHRKAIRSKGRQCIFHKIPTAHKIGTQAVLLRPAWLVFKKMGILRTNQTAVAAPHNIGITVDIMHYGTAENDGDLIVVVGMYSGISIIGNIEANICLFPGGGRIIWERGTNLLRHFRNVKGSFLRQNSHPPFSIEFTTKHRFRQVPKITNYCTTRDLKNNEI